MAKIALTEIVDDSYEEDNFGVGLFKALTFGIGGAYVAPEWYFKEKHHEQFLKVDFKLNASEVAEIEPTVNERFKNAGARTTVWTNEGEEIHVAQPPHVVRVLLANARKPKQQAPT